MRVLSLASGSSGNAYLVLTDTAKVLIDAGVGVMALRRALQTNGLNATELDAVFITHEHYDHVRGLCRLIRGCSPPVYGTEATLRRLELPWNQAEPVLPEQTVTVGDLKVTPFAVPHDGVAPVGYFLEDDSCRAMLATDLGYVPEQLLPLMSTADLLVLEANHDLHWLNRGPYPRFLKERVASDHGHLSNDQTWRCLLRLPNLLTATGSAVFAHESGPARAGRHRYQGCRTRPPQPQLVQ